MTSDKIFPECVLKSLFGIKMTTGVRCILQHDSYNSR